MSLLCRSILVFLAVNICGFLLPPQVTVSKTSVHTHTVGPFTIGRVHKMSVYARITHVRLGPEYGYWRDSDTLLVVVDKAGRELFRRSAETTLGGARTYFELTQIELLTVGKVLMITTSVTPADEGKDFQLFSVNFKGAFVPIACEIPLYTYKFVFLDTRTKEQPREIDSTEPYAALAIEVPLWSGYYQGMIYYRIYSQGFSEGKDRLDFHFDQIPVITGPLDTAKWRQIQHDERDTISLFANPAGIAKRIVKPFLEIKFLHAVYQHGWWLRVSIDGKNGYLEINDCGKLGFPETSGMPWQLEDDY